jgi:cytochrome c-type biogenesis protein CcmE
LFIGNLKEGKMDFIRMKKSTKRTGLVIILLLAGVCFLIIKGISDTGVYYRTVAEVLNDPSLPDKRGVRISGEVVKDTITYDQSTLLLVFQVRDNEEPEKIMKVIYKGIKPDAFKEDIEVILEGRYEEADRTFHAATLLAKCPSKYEGEEQVKE